jgi:hypothetical protein
MGSLNTKKRRDSVSSNRGGVSLVLVVKTDTGVANLGEFLQVLGLSFLVFVGDNSLLICCNTQHIGFLGVGKILESLSSVCDLANQDGHEWVSLVSHNSSADSIKCCLECSFHDFAILSRVGDSSVNLLHRGSSNLTNEILEVDTLIHGY